ncbi:MAG: DUF488 domain-containing protein [Rhodospirillaceae bacterium]|nr:DUF488 domain-containing protein [Rhodospirillaceae bacterium]
MTTVFTIGYERASPEEVVQALKAAGVTVLADVRAVPNSRRRGFSKRALTAAMEDAGLHYRHFVALGNPKEGREAGHAGRMDDFRRIFAAQLATDAAGAALQDLADLVEREQVCLLCYEADADHCHRSIVAAALGSRMALDIRHLRAAAGPGDG